MKLKVTDELKYLNILLGMHTFEKYLALNNNLGKVTLDFDKLQVISLDSHELLSLNIKHVNPQT